MANEPVPNGSTRLVVVTVSNGCSDPIQSWVVRTMV